MTVHIPPQATRILPFTAVSVRSLDVDGIRRLAAAMQPCPYSADTLARQLFTYTSEDTKARVAVLVSRDKGPVGWVGIKPYSEDESQFATTTFLVPALRRAGVGWMLKCFTTHLASADVIVSVDTSEAGAVPLRAHAQRAALLVDTVKEPKAGRHALVVHYPLNHTHHYLPHMDRAVTRWFHEKPATNVMELSAIR